MLLVASIVGSRFKNLFNYKFVSKLNKNLVTLLISSYSSIMISLVSVLLTGFENDLRRDASFLCTILCYVQICLRLGSDWAGGRTPQCGHVGDGIHSQSRRNNNNSLSRLVAILLYYCMSILLTRFSAH